METSFEHRVEAWVGKLTWRTAAFLNLARVYEVQARKIQSNLERVLSLEPQPLTPATCKLPAPKSICR